MTETPKIQSIKGVRDILPPESTVWNRVEEVARSVFGTFRFSEIRSPAFESIELFARSVGPGTDIVSKEMYSFDVSAFQDLFHWHSEMSHSMKDPVRFAGCVYEYLQRAEYAWEAQRIERTSENRKALDSLKTLYKDLYGRVHDEIAAKDEEWDEQINSLMFDAFDFTRQLEGWPQFVALRPEATASVVRAYIEHGMHTLPGDVKLYYMGPMFRRERPQKGRYRQFYQIGAEVLTPSPKDAPENVVRDAGVDAEVIEMVLTFIERCGLVGHTLYINSIGCKDCRPKYVEALRAALVKVKDKLGADSQRRIETNPLRVLDSKVESEQGVIEKLPRMGDHLCEACREHFKMLQAMLFMRQIAYEVNWRLVRGLDYYMRTTFEITAPGLGAQNAVCGGGRYDGLVELLGGPPTKGIGFALGTDRLVLALQEAGKGAVAQPPDAYIAWMGASAYPVAVRLAHALRGAGFSVELPHEEMKFKKSLGLAARLNARFAVILGDNEVAAGTCTVKRLSDGTQKTIAEKDLAAHLRL